MSTFHLIIEIHPPDGPVTKFSLPVGETIDRSWRYNRDGMDPELLVYLNEDTNKVLLFTPPGVDSIIDYAFAEYPAIYCVTIPEGAKRIGKDAFRGCSSLASVTMPDGVTSIGRWAFDGCSSLASVILPEGLTSIESGAFKGCTTLASLSIPVGVTSIGDCAFKGCTSLASVSIPEGVTSIGARAFSGCSSLVSASIPEGVKFIYERTFSGCNSLASVSIPKGVMAIYNNAFMGCDLLTVVIPQSCFLIFSGAFKDCANLSLVVSPQEFEVDNYEDDYMIIHFEVPGGSVEDVFENCPCLTLPYITPYSRDAVLAACRMEYWTQTNHSLIKPFRRDWVLFVVLMLTHLKLPSLVQLKILKMLKRYELGKLI